MSDKSGVDNPMFGRKHSEEAKRKMSEKKKLKSKEYSERLKGNSITKGRKLALSDEARQALRDRIAKVNEKGFINKGGRCKFYQYAGIDVQGRYELIYLRRLILSGITPEKGKPIKTPYGFYTPDFDLGDRFVEVKSTYTIETSKESG